MFEQKQYKDWSAEFHGAYAKIPIVMQMEVTYRCPIHCVHCYSDCYNNADASKQELTGDQIKSIMDKLHKAGCLWFTFTGGDPMARKDFVDLYKYAKQKGFICSVMTSLVGLTDDILEMFVAQPPFSISMTLNGATQETYEKISGVKGSFKKVMENINKVINAKLPLTIKTLASKNNLHELDKIKVFVESLGLEFSASTHIFARLNGDTAPCRYRMDIEDIVGKDLPDDEECSKDADDNAGTDAMNEDVAENGKGEIGHKPNRFYRCAIGNWQWHIDPYGKLNICSCVREPSYDIMKGDVNEGVGDLSEYIANKTFSRESECKSCKIYHLCHSCPGKAKLEVKDEEMPVEYFCKLAKAQAMRYEKGVL